MGGFKVCPPAQKIFLSRAKTWREREIIEYVFWKRKGAEKKLIRATHPFS